MFQLKDSTQERAAERGKLPGVRKKGGLPVFDSIADTRSFWLMPVSSSIVILILIANLSCSLS